MDVPSGRGCPSSAGRRREEKKNRPCCLSFYANRRMICAAITNWQWAVCKWALAAFCYPSFIILWRTSFFSGPHDENLLNFRDTKSLFLGLYIVCGRKEDLTNLWRLIYINTRKKKYWYGSFVPTFGAGARDQNLPKSPCRNSFRRLLQRAFQKNKSQQWLRSRLCFFSPNTSDYDIIIS